MVAEVLFERYDGVLGFLVMTVITLAIIILMAAVVIAFVFLIAHALELMGLIPPREDWWK